jgi:zinc transport system ATP-binding protein
MNGNRRSNQEDLDAAIKALEDVNLVEAKNKTFGELSGGQKQRVLIARAIVCNPKLLIFDEPTANIDILIENKLLDVFKKLNKKMAVIIVSHNLRFVADSIDKVICMNEHFELHETTSITDELISALKKGHYKAVLHKSPIKEIKK